MDHLTYTTEETNPVESAMDSLQFALSEILSELEFIERSTPDERNRAMAYVLRRNTQIAFASVRNLIDKLQSRPAQLEALKDQLIACTTSQEVRDANRAIGAMLVQHPDFDREVLEIREAVVYRENEFRAAEEMQS